MSTESTYTLASDESIQRTIEALAARNVDAVRVESREAALAKLKELVPEGCQVFVSTSETLDTIGYTEYMHGNDRYDNLHDRMLEQPDAAAQREFRRTTTTADYFVGSVQAIAETGEIVVASGSGSQIGAFAYGARRVIMVAGTQKICPTLAEAEARTRGYTLETPRPLAGGPGRVRRAHRQIPGDGARAGGGADHDDTDPGEPGVVRVLI